MGGWSFRTWRRVAGFAGALVVVALAAAGCGGSSNLSGHTDTNSSSGELSKPAAQVLADAVMAVRTASSFRISGEVMGSPVHLSFVAGKGAIGSLTNHIGGKVDLIVVGRKAYWKSGKAYWTNVLGSYNPELVRRLSGKWVEYPNNDLSPSSYFLTNPTVVVEYLKAMGGNLALPATVTSDGATTFKGQSVVAITGSQAEWPKGLPKATLYVANTGTPYPVAIVNADGFPHDELDFDSWNAPVRVTAPAGALQGP
jgi:hypothetical protein